MSIKSEIKEEQEAWLASGKSLDEYFEYQKERSENVVYVQPKKARYKGVDLYVGDVIVNNSQLYLITDFTEKAVPIVKPYGGNWDEYFEKEWEFGADFGKLVPFVGE